MAVYDANMLAFATFPEITRGNKIETFYAAYNSVVVPAEQLEKLMQVRYHFVFRIYKIVELVSNTIIRNFRI